MLNGAGDGLHGHMFDHSIQAEHRRGSKCQTQQMTTQTCGEEVSLWSPTDSGLIPGAATS